MKELTGEEFNDRMIAVARARKIFIESGVTNNISKAFELYQEVLAEHYRDVFLDTYSGGKRQQTFIDTNYIRPNCPTCRRAGRGTQPLYLRIINIPQGRDNVKGYKSEWVCVHPNCIYEEYSFNTLEDWMNELPRKDPSRTVVKIVRGG